MNACHCTPCTVQLLESRPVRRSIFIVPRSRAVPLLIGRVSRIACHQFSRDQPSKLLPPQEFALFEQPGNACRHSARSRHPDSIAARARRMPPAIPPALNWLVPMRTTCSHPVLRFAWRALLGERRQDDCSRPCRSSILRFLAMLPVLVMSLTLA